MPGSGLILQKQLIILFQFNGGTKMNKLQFMENLRQELKNNKIPDIEEILEEYEEHFAYKLIEGKTEEEIARKLKSPKDIADDYLELSDKKSKPSKDILSKIGIVSLSIPAFPIYIFMWASALVMILAAAAFAVISICLIFKLNIENLIPAIPYLSAFTMGIASIAAAFLFAIISFYIFIYTKQWGKAYFRWCKNIFNGNM